MSVTILNDAKHKPACVTITNGARLEIEWFGNILTVELGGGRYIGELWQFQYQTNTYAHERTHSMVKYTYTIEEKCEERERGVEEVALKGM